jgi:hypothetical protein
VSERFLYQINFNKRKYPEICKALEDAKHDEGIAWYLRQLISKDIESKKNRSFGSNESPPVFEETKPKKTKEKPKKEEVKLPDDNGGFM